MEHPEFGATIEPGDRIEVALVNPQPGERQSVVLAVIRENDQGHLRRVGSIQLYLTGAHMLDAAVGLRDCAHEVEALNRLARTESEVADLAEVGG